MSVYMVRLPNRTATRVRGNAMVVRAVSTTAAKEIAQAYYGGDGNFISGGVTETVGQDFGVPTIGTAGTLENWRFIIRVTGSGGAAKVELTPSGTDTMDDIGADLATALNLLPNITTASYASATNILTVAVGATDALGDQHLTVLVLPPIRLGAGGQENQDVHQSMFISSVVHEGISSDNLSIQYAADTTVLPTVLQVCTVDESVGGGV